MGSFDQPLSPSPCDDEDSPLGTRRTFLRQAAALGLVLSATCPIACGEALADSRETEPADPEATSTVEAPQPGDEQEVAERPLS